MKDYKIKTDIVEITLESGKIVKVAKKWVDTAMKNLDTDIEDVLLMWLEDNDYLVNEEQEELDTKAKTNQPKRVEKSTTERKKVVREKKVNSTKAMVIEKVAEMLNSIADNVVVENVDKIITFSIDNQDFKIDLTQKRVKKSE